MGEKMTLEKAAEFMRLVDNGQISGRISEWVGLREACGVIHRHLTQPAQAVDDDTLLDIARRVGLRQQFTGVNAEDAKFLLRAFVDALPNANGKENTPDAAR